MVQLFWSCEKFNCKLNLYSLADVFSATSAVDHIEHVYNSVIDNCKILESCNNWAILQYLEAYHKCFLMIFANFSKALLNSIL